MKIQVGFSIPFIVVGKWSVLREVGRGLLMSGYIHSKWLFLQELSVERWRKEALFEGRNQNSFTFLHCCTVLLKMLRNKVLIALFYHLGPQVSKVRWGRIGNKRVGTWAHAVICQTMLSQGGCEHTGGEGGGILTVLNLHERKKV